MLLEKEINDSLTEISTMIKDYHTRLQGQKDEKVVWNINKEIEELKEAQILLKTAQKKEGMIRDDLIREAMHIVLICDYPKKETGYKEGEMKKAYYHKIFESLL